MNTMKTLVVDDEPSSRNGIVRVLSNFSQVTVIGEAHSSKTLLNALEQHQPDLVFLDIMLRNTNSLDVLMKLPKIPLIIITTAYDNHALKGFNLKAVDYLMKPISESKLRASIERAFTLFSSEIKNTNTLFVKSGGRYVRILIDEILFVKGMQNYVTIHTLYEKYTCKMTLKTIGLYLKDKGFIQVHKSYIVSLDQIEGFEKQTIFMKEFELPIGKTMKENTYKALLG